MGDQTWLRHAVLSVAVVGLLAIGACGSDTEDSAPAGDEASAGTSQDTDAAGDLPACDEVWRTGEELPRGYEGCTEDGATVPPAAISCSSGQTFVTFEESHYAVVGGLVREVEGDIDTDPAYRDAVRSCRA